MHDVVKVTRISLIQLKVRIRGLALALFCTPHRLVTDNGRTPLASARQEEADAWGGGGVAATPLYTEFWARNHAALEHIDVVVGHGHSGVRGRETGSISSGLSLTLREDWFHKRALETPCHARIATSPQDTTGHVSGPANPKVTWGTKFPADVRLPKSQRLMGQASRPCDLKRVIVTPAMYHHVSSWPIDF